MAGFVLAVVFSLRFVLPGQIRPVEKVTGLMACGTIGYQITDFFLFSSQFDRCTLSKVLSVAGGLSSQFTKCFLALIK